MQSFIGSVLVMRPTRATMHYVVATEAPTQKEAWDMAATDILERWKPVTEADHGPIFVELMLESLEEVLDASRAKEARGSSS